jgi:poly-gamma-glutamate synthase PgsB/CapB
VGEQLFIPLFLCLLLVAAGAIESHLHRRRLRRLPIRIHVNGSRGKSSVVRLIAAGLRAGGIPTVAKTTGSAARLILPDGSEVPVRRFGPANIKEQIGVVRRATRLGARALVAECMAIRPELGRVSERRLLRSTLGVITNVRPDHLDLMGPTVRHVADSLAQTVPWGGSLFYAGDEWGDRFRRVARRRRSTVHLVSPAEVNPADLDRFGHVEHRENVALALAVCRELGIDGESALRAMQRAAPDPGALRRFRIRFFDKQLEFVNAFAANDPESTLEIWRRLGLRRDPDRPAIALLNLRRDRAHRGHQFAKLVAGPLEADSVVLVGETSDLAEKQAIGYGLAPSRIVNLGPAEPAEVFEAVFELTPARSVVVGIGNLVGRGERIAHYFENRRIVP